LSWRRRFKRDRKKRKSLYGTGRGLWKSKKEEIVPHRQEKSTHIIIIPAKTSRPEPLRNHIPSKEGDNSVKLEKSIRLLS
jgi:hypothetical protein